MRRKPTEILRFSKVFQASLIAGSQNPLMSGKRFLGLDGLRGVCALTVLLFHAANLFDQGPIFQHGYLAVDMFFLMSGFVIAFIHEERLRSGMGLIAFLRIRARRLLPVFWIGANAIRPIPL